jgi:hypothetical protein
VLFGEWAGDSGAAIALKLGGIAAVIAGVAVLSAFDQPGASAEPKADS